MIIENKNIIKKEPNKLLQMAVQQIKITGEFLDLGCGSGMDAVFMANNGFKVTAVDSAQEKITSLQEIVKENNFESKIKLLCQDINSFEIEKDKYQIIQAFNSLQFLDKEIGLKVVEDIKEKIMANGFVIISCFTVNDSLYQKPIPSTRDKNRCFFEPDELKNLFLDWEIVFCEEKIIDDKGHQGFEVPHQHAIARLVAEKKI